MPYGYLLLVPLLFFFFFLLSQLWAEVVCRTRPEEVLELRLGLSWRLGQKELRAPLYSWRPGKNLMERWESARRKGRIPALAPGDWRFFLRLGSRLLKAATLRASGRLRLGTGDAGGTGFAVGLFWSVLGLTQALAKAVCREADIGLRIEPEFTRAELEIDARCILSVPVIHIISTAARGLTYFKKARQLEPK